MGTVNSIAPMSMRSTTLMVCIGMAPPRIARLPAKRVSEKETTVAVVNFDARLLWEAGAGEAGVEVALVIGWSHAHWVTTA
jgi:hypothetical protein